MPGTTAYLPELTPEKPNIRLVEVRGSAVLLRWDEPRYITNIDQVYVYRASSKTGTYSRIATPNAKNEDGVWNGYHEDPDGTSTSWYKISFYDSNRELESTASDVRTNGLKFYANIEKFRDLTSFKAEQINNYDVQQLREIANRIIIEDVTSYIYLERLTGNINGSNTEFKTEHFPLADSNFDRRVDEDDVEVYYATYTDSQNFLDYGSEQTVSSVEELNGIINLSTAPTSTTAEAGVFAIYRYYAPKRIINYNILELAANYFLGYLAANKIAGQTPRMSSIEEYRVRRDTVGFADMPGIEYLKLALQILDKERDVHFRRGEDNGS
jgi:hypothetical protein